MSLITDNELPKPILIEDLGMMFSTENSKRKYRFGIYKCGFCGTEFKANTYDINRGHIKSCGCYNKKRTKEENTKHGLGYTRLYHIWINIKSRTLNSKYKHYNDYGGRGIIICDEWKNDFMSFHNWAMSNGYSDELSIDRIDNDGNYEPNNCRWTTNIIQSRNRRIRKDNTSGYKGVSYDKRAGNYQTYVGIKSKRIHLGYFQTAVEGAIAYNNYIIENNLEGFILNEIPQESLKGEIMEENKEYKILYKHNYIGRVLFLVLHKHSNRILPLYLSSGYSGTGHKGEILPFMYLNEKFSIRGEPLGYIYKQMLYKGNYINHYKDIPKDIIQFLNPIKEFIQEFRDERTIEELNHFMDEEFTIEYVRGINTELRDIIKEYKLFDYYEDLNKIQEEEL